SPSGRGEWFLPSPLGRRVGDEGRARQFSLSLFLTRVALTTGPSPSGRGEQCAGAADRNPLHGTS
ncbi:MAG: hypothetical protein ACK44E_11980, partial [Anaerolineales bacterium]